MVQWLRLCTLNLCGGPGLIPGGGWKYPPLPTITKETQLYFLHTYRHIHSTNPLDNFYEKYTLFIIRMNTISFPIFLCPTHINFSPKSISVECCFPEESIVPEAMRFRQSSCLMLRLLCSLQVSLSFPFLTVQKPDGTLLVL